MRQRFRANGLRVEPLEDRTVPAKLDVVVTAATVYATEAGVNSATDLTLPLDPGNANAHNELTVQADSRVNGHVDGIATAGIVGDRFAGVNIGTVAGVKVSQSGYGTSEHPYQPMQLNGEAATSVRVRVVPDDPAEVGTPIVVSVRAFTDPHAGLSFINGRSAVTAFYSGEAQSETFFSTPLEQNPIVQNVFRDVETTVGAEFQFQTHVVVESNKTTYDGGPVRDGLARFVGGESNSVGLTFQLKQPDFAVVPNADPKDPDTFLWNTVEEGGGFQFTYAVTPAADGSVPDTVIDFFWATGPRYEDRLPDAKAYEFVIDTPEEKRPGEQDLIEVVHTDLLAGHRTPVTTDPVTGDEVRASYLVMVIDPTPPGTSGRVRESSEGNNVTALKVVPLVVNVVTHGFAPPNDVAGGHLPHNLSSYLSLPDFVDDGLNSLTVLPQSDPKWAAFRQRFVDIGNTLDALPAPGSILDGRVATYVTEWDSSTGFAQAFAYRMLAVLAQAAANKNRQDAATIHQLLPGEEALTNPLTAPGYLKLLDDARIEDGYVRRWQQKVREYARVSRPFAEAAVATVTRDLTGRPGLLGDLSPVESSRLQRVQFVGHSRGAAVNAGATSLLLAAGYRNIVYYGGLDGFASDFVDVTPPLQEGLLLDGQGLLFSDFEVASAALGSVSEAMKVNYRVEQGLEDVLVQMIDDFVGNYGAFATAAADTLVLDPRTKQAVRDGITLRAQFKDGPGWENATLRQATGTLTSHVNAVDAYLNSEQLPPPERYILDNYLGWHRNDGSAVPKPLQKGDFLREPAPGSPPTTRPLGGLVADAGRGLFRLDPAGGPPARLGTLPFTPYDLAVAPDGTAYALAPAAGTSVLYRLATDAGGVTAARVGPLGAFVNALEFRGDGTLLAAGQDVLYRVDPATGAATAVSRSPVPVLSAGDLAFGPGGDVYLTSDTAGGQLVRVSADLGTWTVVGPTGVPGLGGLQFDGGTLFGYGPQGAVYRIEQQTGEAVPTGGLAGVGSAIGAGAVPGRTAARVGAAQFAAGADAGGLPTVRFFDPDGTVRAAGLAFDPTVTGGVRVAAADFTGDGVADVVVGTGPGSSTQVRVLDGGTLAELFTLAPFEASFTGGVYVAAGDLDGDGVADLVVTPDEGGGPRVRAFRGRDFSPLADFFGIDDPNFRGGARATVADLSGDGAGDLVVVAGFGGGPRVAAFDGPSLAGTPEKLFNDFFAFEQSLRNGIFVAAGDLNGDGLADLIAGGGPGGGPRVLAFDGRNLLTNTQTPLANFFGGDANSRGGIRLAVKDLDGDARADLIVGAGAGAGSRVTAYLGKNVGPDGPPAAELDFDAAAGSTAGVFVG